MKKVLSLGPGGPEGSKEWKSVAGTKRTKVFIIRNYRNCALLFYDSILILFERDA